ncbi:hypothetical protein [Rhodococcus wratislaviensis]|uniref:hypothetical protein n=1 Tax=Rhodococcus wratislaviensis TaxID=44752 RepID=UPI0036543740
MRTFAGARAARMKLLGVVHSDSVDLGGFEQVIADRGADLEYASFAMNVPPKLNPEQYDGIFLMGGAAQVDEVDKTVRYWAARWPDPAYNDAALETFLGAADEHGPDNVRVGQQICANFVDYVETQS